ncbi:hypothetical protein LWF15_30490 [Kineosporia rhizophila]|uniref:hypothetical protein n=1 Tax=Kineosporia TaxID=49184 RepID=UPI001E44735C|nr:MULTISPECIES: hypothetical protein [Kineosporia]MCE0539834.1 hypothetical protein [Kineosporia rhizophila]
MGSVEPSAAGAELRASSDSVRCDGIVVCAAGRVAAFTALELFFTAALPAPGSVADLVAASPALLAERFGDDARAAERGAMEVELAAD